MARARRYSGRAGGRVSGDIHSYNFVRGFITEASPINFPENASLSEVNFELLRTGARNKRKGFDTLSSSAYGDEVTNTTSSTRYDNHPGSKIDTHYWKSAGPDQDNNILVIRVGRYLRFYDADTSGSVIDNFIEEFDMSTDIYKSTLTVGQDTTPVEITSGNGFLFIVGEGCLPTYIKLDNYLAGGTIESGVVNFSINYRDFDGVDDGLGLAERPNTMSEDHEYNLINQGWANEQILASRNFGVSGTAFRWAYDEFYWYTGQVGTSGFPSNKDIFHLGRLGAQSANVFNLYTYEAKVGVDKMVYVLNTEPAPKGEIILDAVGNNNIDLNYNGTTYNIDNSSNYAATTAFYAGRFWTVVKDTLYYSQVVEGEGNISKFYQEASPVREDLNELVATDGGTLKLKDAGRVIKLLAYKQSLIVFCQKGVWVVSGSDGTGFDATNQALTKVFSEGTENPHSVIDMDDGVMYCTEAGIYVLSNDPATGSLTFQNLSEGTIQTYWNNLSAQTKASLRGVYDRRGRKVSILLDSGHASFANSQEYDVILNFDVSLGAFYLYEYDKFTYTSGGRTIDDIFIKDAIYLDVTPVFQTNEVNVTNSGGTLVVNSGATQVVINETALSSVNSGDVIYITTNREVNGSDYKTFLNVGRFESEQYTDWYTIAEDLSYKPGDDGDYDYSLRQTRPEGLPYTASLLTGYFNLGDISKEKSINYIHTAMDRTEEELIEGGVNPDYIDHLSSCKMSVLWNWTDSFATNKKGEPQEIYRRRVPYIFGSPAAIDDGTPVVTTKTKVRGRGKSFHLLFESPEYFDCRLLGWSIAVSQARNV